MTEKRPQDVGRERSVNRAKQIVPRWKQTGPLPHIAECCGFTWEMSCEDCRKSLWPKRFFQMQPETRLHVPKLRRPFLSQEELIATVHYYRNKPAVKWALMDLLFDDLVELIEDRINAGRRK